MKSLHRLCNVHLLLLSYILITAVNGVEGAYFFYQQPEYPRDCKEVYAQCSSNNSSGVYSIKPDGYPEPFEVYCDNELSKGGWTVIQRQLDGSLQFSRGWKDYERGFGFLSSEFYVGNRKISYLTNQASYELRIDMVLSNRSHFYIGYKKFRISDAWGQYALVTADEFRGNSSCVVTSCHAGMVHGNCSCRTYCGDPDEMTDCYEICEETCEPKGCFVDEANTFILEGEFYSDPACFKMCSCANGVLRCNDSYRCDENAVCQNRSRHYQCHCDEGYSGDGVVCRSICEENELYGICSCQRSCSNPDTCTTCNNVKRCYCPNGFYLQGGNCVPQEDCGCFFDGRILTNGETSINSNCSWRCTCNNNQLNCDRNYRCTSNAGCRVRSGVRQCYCDTGYEGDGVTSCTRPYTDCNDVKNARQPSGVYSIRPTGWTGSPFNVFCNMSIDGGGWTVIQRRINGAENFYTNWNAYKNGFGNLQQEFWLGNEKLYYLTQQATYECRFDFVTASRSAYHNKYSRFRINNESNKYRVTDVGGRSGSGYTLDDTQNIAFSTYDRDSDGKSVTDCAEGHRSGWWHGGYYYGYSTSSCYYYREGSRHRSCSYANLNGVYSGGNGQKIFVSHYYCNIKYTEMKIRRTS